MNDGYDADALHGDLSQAQRDYVMNRFRIKNLQILVATDVAARGLDVQDLSHIINYNLPDDIEIYVHRSGRTGRAGKKGISISILNTREISRIHHLERIINKKFVRKMVPTGKEICEKQLFNLVDKVEKIEVNNTQIEQFLPDIYKKLEWLERDELIKHFISVKFNRFLEYYKNAANINVTVNDRERGNDKFRDNDRNRNNDREGRKSFSSNEYSRFFINIGINNKLNAARLIGLINETTRNRNIPIGKIDLMKKFSFFEVEKQYEKEILKAFDDNTIFEDVSVVVELSKPFEGAGKSENNSDFRKRTDKRDFKNKNFKKDFKKKDGFKKRRNF